MHTRSSSSGMNRRWVVVALLPLLNLFRLHRASIKNNSMMGATNSRWRSLQFLPASGQVATNFLSGGGKQRLHSRDPCLVVYHIPKTGGVTLGYYLANMAATLGWRYQEWYRSSKVPLFMRIIREKRIKGRYLNDGMIHIGHFTPHFVSATNTTNCVKLTVLREPVDRVISAFYYHLHKEEDWDECLGENNTGSCTRWHEYHNDVVRRFANRGTTWTSYDVAAYCPSNENLTRSALHLAKQQMMSGLDFICLLSNLRECIQHIMISVPQFSNTFSTEELIVKNKGNITSEISDKIRNETARANELDVELYEWVKQNLVKHTIPNL